MQYRNPHAWICTADLLWLKGQVPPHRQNPLEQQANYEVLSVWPPFLRDETTMARRTACEVCESDKFCLPILRSNQGPVRNASDAEMDDSPNNKTLQLPSDFGSEESYDSQISEAARIDAQIDEERAMVGSPRKRKSDEMDGSHHADLMDYGRSAKSPKTGAAGTDAQIAKNVVIAESILEREKEHLLELCRFGGKFPSTSLKDMGKSWEKAEEQILAALLRESLEKR